MPIFHSPFHSYFQYFLKRRTNPLFLSIALRSLALSLILIFEPIYVFLFFKKSLFPTLIFFGTTFGIYSILAVFGGKGVARFGARKMIFLSHFCFFLYYLSLYLLSFYPQLIILAIILKGMGMSLFWPAFHLDFSRFVQKSQLGKEVGNLNAILLVPTILGPMIGGEILNRSGYPLLFSVSLGLLIVSIIPLFFTSQTKEEYTDSYQKAFARIFTKRNIKMDLAFAANGAESVINAYLWPLFLFTLAIKYLDIGSIASISLAGGIIFSFYLGKISNSSLRFKTLNFGALLTSIAWGLKYFVRRPLQALATQSFYRLARTTAAIPFKTLFYQEAIHQVSQADEFIIYREIIMNIAKFFILFLLACFFWFIPKINLSFLLASIISLGLIFLGKTPKIFAHNN